MFDGQTKILALHSSRKIKLIKSILCFIFQTIKKIKSILLLLQAPCVKGSNYTKFKTQNIQNLGFGKNTWF